MKQLLSLLCCMLAVYTTYAQGISSAEYFVDTDPGVGNATAISITPTTNDSIIFQANIPTTSFTQGFHFLGIRVKDGNGQWGLFETKGFYIASTVINTSHVVAAEYFFDNDPGMGNGTSLSVGTTGDSVSFNPVIPITSLQSGFHFIGIRVKNNDGQWGLLEAKGFYIASTAINASHIVAAEYFFDNDPGKGNGTSLSVGTTGDSVSFNPIISTASLQSGFHFLGIRAKNNDGQWGLVETKGFYITSTALNANAIVSAEYFIDNDPGKGNGTNVVIGATGDSISFVASVPTIGLSEGFHFLAMRVKDSNDRWSEYEQKGFYVTTTAVASLSNIVAAEYFIDTDPGVGNASALVVALPDTTINQTFICNTPSGLANGQHLLVVRVKDNNDRWSLAEVDTFTVNSVLPITGLRLEAAKKEHDIVLVWETVTELNTDFFEVEKSGNGIDFEKIGMVTAAGNSNEKQHYQFIDTSPFSELNFYRIKQVDLNRKYAYSNIVNVLFHSSEQNIQLYPNPATDVIYLSLTKENTYWLQCYNAQGQLMFSKEFVQTKDIRFDITSWGTGTYHIRLTNGSDIMSASFIKQ